MSKDEAADEIALWAITEQHGPRQYAEQAQAGNWPIWRCARRAALLALARKQDTPA